MDIRIEKPVLGGKIKAISSKSQAHRLLICAALSDKITVVECAETSEDIAATAECLIALGGDVLREKGEFIVKPIEDTALIGKKTLDCGESGSTYRFMLPIAGALGVSAAFLLKGRLPSRPMAPLLRELSLHGCTITGVGGSPVYCGGKLESGSFTLPGDVSSQFISGLLLALPRLKGDSVIAVEGREESKPYIALTRDALRIFDIDIEKNGGRYYIPGGQTFHSPGTVFVEGDWSNAAFWLCAGALGHGVTCTGLNLWSSQGDMAVTTLLERFGADVEYGGDGVTVSRSRKLRGIKIDASDTPDLVPVLAAVAAVAEGETVIYNAERLRIKESDRLKTVADTLRALGADIEESQGGLTIRGKDLLDGGEVSAHGDHRIAMTAAIASAVCKNAVTITEAEAVRKSYPGFFEDFYRLGGEIDIMEAD